MIDETLFQYFKEKDLVNKIKENIVLEKDVVKMYTSINEKKIIPDLLGKTVKVSKKQFKEINMYIEEICNVLEMDRMVSAYVYEDFYYGVESKGISNPWIEISAKTIEDFSEKQLKFLIAKELYNIKFNKTYYSILIDAYIKGSKFIKITNSSMTEEAIKLLFYKWSRTMNFSSDNFGLVICGDIQESIKAILLTILNNKKLVKSINICEYIKQADEINRLNDNVYEYTKLDELVPYGPFRIKNLIGYFSSLRCKNAMLQLK